MSIEEELNKMEPVTKIGIIGISLMIIIGLMYILNANNYERILGLSYADAGTAIIIGIVVGFLLPFKSIMRSHLHFTLQPNKKSTLEKDCDALNDLTKVNKKIDKEILEGFGYCLRRLGLTLYIKE